jgi:hypothetical protein
MATLASVIVQQFGHGQADADTSLTAKVRPEGTSTDVTNVPTLEGQSRSIVHQVPDRPAAQRVATALQTVIVTAQHQMWTIPPKHEPP